MKKDHGQGEDGAGTKEASRVTMVDVSRLSASWSFAIAINVI